MSTVANLEVESEVVNWNGVLAGVVLHHSSEKSLCEKEAGHPEHGRLSLVVPVLHSIRTTGTITVLIPSYRHETITTSVP